jgi:hypothetical protein
MAGNQTVHWDGDDPLFVTIGSNTIEEIMLPGIGTAVPVDPSYNSSSPGYRGFTVLDRDPTGQVAGSHNATGAGPFFGHTFFPYREFYFDYNQSGSVALNYCGGYLTAGSANFKMPNSFWPQGPYVTCDYASNGLLFDPRGEGQSDGNLDIQGVRTFNSNVVQWTAPDAYSGEVGDPMSEQPYMWDRNNPVSYSDPSGYDTVLLEARPAGAKAMSHTRRREHTEHDRARNDPEPAAPGLE